MPKILLSLIILSFSWICNYAQDTVTEMAATSKDMWVDSVYNTLDQQERVAQLIIIPAAQLALSL